MLIPVFCRVIFYLVVPLLWAGLTLASVDIGFIERDQRDGYWSLGAAARVQASPYRDEEVVADFFPVLSYSGKRLFINGPKAGVHAWDSERWSLDTYVAYRFQGYNDKSHFYGSSETRSATDILKGMERSYSWYSGVSAQYKSGLGLFTLDVSTDANNTHKGSEAGFYWSTLMEKGRWSLAPWLGPQYQSRQLVDYYYGVRSNEAKLSRPAYSFTKGLINWRAGLDAEYQVDVRNFLALKLHWTRLDSDVFASPLLEQQELLGLYLSYRHEFNDFPPLTFHNDNRLSSFFRNNPSPWFWRVAGGCSTRVVLNSIVKGNIRCDNSGAGLRSLFVGRKVSDSLWGSRWDVWLKGGYAHRFENGAQENFGEYILAIKTYWSHFPWSESIKTRFGFAEGLSYGNRIPFSELEAVNKGRRSSHLLNYLDVSLDVSLGDLFNHAPLKNCYSGFSVHHRSGIFGLASLFNHVNGGSNVNTLYLECVIGS